MQTPMIRARLLRDTVTWSQDPAHRPQYPSPTRLSDIRAGVATSTMSQLSAVVTAAAGASMRSWALRRTRGAVAARTVVQPLRAAGAARSNRRPRARRPAGGAAGPGCRARTRSAAVPGGTRLRSPGASPLRVGAWAVIPHSLRCIAREPFALLRATVAAQRPPAWTVTVPQSQACSDPQDCTVRGLPLPNALASLLRSGRWLHPGEQVLHDLMPWFEDPLDFMPSLNAMRFENAALDHIADDSSIRDLFG